MKNKIMNIFKKEMREVFRDKKSLAMMLIIPILIPLLVLGMSALFEMESNTKEEDYNKIGIAYELSNEEKELLDEFKIEYQEGTEEEIKNAYNEGKLDSFITLEENKYTINYDAEKSTSVQSRGLSENYLEAWKKVLQARILSNNELNPEQVFNVIFIDYQTEENTSNFFAEYITSYAFLFIIMAITISATYPATDSTAGEKERGTLETLLSFPIKSRDIIIGKLMSVTLASIITGALSLVLSLVSLAYANGAFEIYKEINIMPNISTIILSIIIIIVYSLFISGISIAIASMSKTFKEAQSALTPITFVSFFPGMIAFLTDVKTSALTSIIPFLNFTQIFNDVNGGNINILNISLMIISSVIYIAVIIWYIIRQYRSEKILFNS
ncbi:MAG: ABC transporter permease [Bacilli bacterium]|nr:ABC transporter permease [Bacilli bacterium]